MPDAFMSLTFSKWKFSSAVLLCGLTFCLSGPASTQAQPEAGTSTIQINLSEAERTWIAAHPVVTLAVDQFNPPMNARDADGKFSGLSLDYMALIAKKSGLHLEFAGSTWDEALRRAMAHDVDGVMGARIKEDRKVALAFSEPYVETPIAMLVGPAVKPVKALGDFHDQRIAVVKNTVRVPVIAKYCPSCVIVEVPSARDGVKLLAKGEVQGFFDDLPVINRLVKEEQLVSHKVALLFYYSEAGTVRLALNKNHPELLNIVNKAILAISPVEHRAIREKWLQLDNAIAVQRESSLALTVEQSSWLAAHPVIRVGLDPNREPIEWRNEAGEYQGIAIEYLHRLEQQLGLQFEIVHADSWAEIMQKTRARQIDVLLSIPETPEGRSFLNFTKPYLSSPLVVFGLADQAYLQDLRGLAGKRLGVLDGLAAASYVARDWPDIKVVKAENRSQVVAMLRKQKIDAFIGALMQTSYELAKTGGSDIRVIGETPYTYQQSIAVRSDWPELFAILDKALESISSVDRADFQQKWLPLVAPQKFDYRLLWWLLLPTVIGLAFIIQLRIMVRDRTADLRKEVETRKQRENALIESEASYQLSLRGSSAGLWDWNLITNAVFFSDRYMELLGYSSAEFPGVFESFRSALHPDDLERVTLALNAHLSKERKPYEIDYRLRTKGGDYRWFHARGEALFNAHGIPYRMAGSTIDITEHKNALAENAHFNDELEQRVHDRTRALESSNAELMLAMEQLRTARDEIVRSERLAALGSLVAGVAHELNTPIGNSVLVASTLEDRFMKLIETQRGKLPRAELDDHLTGIMEAISLLMRNLQKTEELVYSFKQVAVDQTSAQRRKFDLALVLEDVSMTTITPLIRNTIHLLRVDVPHGIMLDSYPGLLGQVFTNIVRNALIHAFTGKGAGEIVVQARTDHPDYIGLMFTDNGAGIAAENISRVFDPFFTTRLGQGSSGLGLNIVHNLVTNVLGGTVSVASQPGNTCFTIRIARSAPVPMTITEATAAQHDGLAGAAQQ
jgi:PAS domain S-box-containing protein